MGLFTLVNVKSERQTTVAILQFSKKGFRVWQTRRFEILNAFRHMSDETSRKANMNVAISLFDTNGQLLGGCVRKNSDRESLCKAK